MIIEKSLGLRTLDQPLKTAPKYEILVIQKYSNIFIIYILMMKRLLMGIIFQVCLE